MPISYDFMISVYQEKFHFRISNKKYFKTLKTHCINCYSLETIFLMTENIFSMTGKWPGIIFIDENGHPVHMFEFKNFHRLSSFFSIMLNFQMLPSYFPSQLIRFFIRQNHLSNNSSHICFGIKSHFSWKAVIDSSSDEKRRPFIFSLTQGNKRKSHSAKSRLYTNVLQF